MIFEKPDNNIQNKLEPIESAASALINAYNIPTEKHQEFTEIVGEVHPYFTHLLYVHKIQRLKYKEIQEYFENTFSIYLIDLDISAFEQLIARYKGESRIDRRKLFKKGFLKAVTYRVKSRSFAHLFNESELPNIETEEQPQNEVLLDLEVDPFVTNYVKHIAYELNLPSEIKNELLSFFSDKKDTGEKLRHINLSIYSKPDFVLTIEFIKRNHKNLNKLIWEYSQTGKENKVILYSLVALENIYYTYLYNKLKIEDEINFDNKEISDILLEYGIEFLLYKDINSIRNEIAFQDIEILNKVIDRLEAEVDGVFNFRLYRLIIEHKHNLESLQNILTNSPEEP